MWPDRRLLDLFGIEHPIVLAPMAGPGTPELAIAVAMSGGLGSLPRAMSSDKQIRHDLSLIRQRRERLSLRRIAQELAATGLLNERGSEYNPNAIKRMVEG
jgi:NAD(P)H-dependent flavin oxidoreductase YrpB (nitropropane dioxygenase family)